MRQSKEKVLRNNRRSDSTQTREREAKHIYEDVLDMETNSCKIVTVLRNNKEKDLIQLKRRGEKFNLFLHH